MKRWYRSICSPLQNFRSSQLHSIVERPKKIVIAIGGNSLVKGNDFSAAGQKSAVVETARQIVNLKREGHQIIVTHGNGPQVGFGLIRSELGEASANLPGETLDIIDAETEGSLGYLLQQAIQNELRAQDELSDSIVPVSLVTQVLVQKEDPGFVKPTKPVGSYFSAADAVIKQRDLGWYMEEQQGKGWRRLVASPEPKKIIEETAINTLIKAGHIVICLGGGGIPVIENENGHLEGVAAVIDKDASSAKLAIDIDSDCIIFSTAVSNVYVNFGKPNQEKVMKATVPFLESKRKDGEFPPGSMGPKITAAIDFLHSTGKVGTQAIITDPSNICSAFHGSSGTTITLH